MPTSIHPPVQLHIVLDEESYEGGDSVEMARRFTAVAPTEVVRAAKGSQRSNVLRFDLGEVAATEESVSDSLWRDALVTWLDEEFAETSALVARENDARRNNGEQPVPFQWTEVKFGMGPVIAIRMIDSTIPAEAAGYVARARALLMQGAFGADPISSIRIPACAAIGVQQAEAEAEDIIDTGRESDSSEESVGAEGSAGTQQQSAVRLPQQGMSEDEILKEIGKEERGSTSVSDIIAAISEAAGFTDNKAGRAASDPDAQNAWVMSEVEADAPTRAEIDDALAQAEAALRQGSDPTDVDAEDRANAQVDKQSQQKMHGGRMPTPAEEEEACALWDDDVPQDLDYRIWNVAYADGTSVRFDSVLGEALLD